MRGFLERSEEQILRIPDVGAEWMVSRAKGSFAGVVMLRCYPSSLQAGVYSLAHCPEDEVASFLHNT